MSTRKKIALVTLLVIFVVSLLLGSVFTACDKNKDDGYSIYVKSLGGLGVANVTVTVTKNGKQIAKGTTDQNGLFALKADTGVYDVDVSDLPLGFTLTGSNYKTSKDSKTLTILVSSSVITSQIPSDKVYRLGDIAYDFSITDKTDRSENVDGKKYTLSQVLAEKKMVLINFWNSSCGPCMREMPALQQVYEQFQDVAEVFAINISGITGTDKLATLRQFKTEGGYTFPVSLDDQDGNNMRYHFQIEGIPVSVVIDRYGVIAMIHEGGLDKSTFTSIFEKYTSDSYVQDQVGGGGDGDGELVREKPNVSMPASSEIEAAINGANFRGTYRPETNSEDAEYSWPWLVGGTGNEKYIYPSNTGVNYSFATIYTSVTITQNDINSNGNVVLAFDLKWSCENMYDEFFVIINNNYVFSYTGEDGWDKWYNCYALVATEPGTYELALLYNKDEQKSEGEDTVHVKNMRLMSIASLDNSTPSLDMPRDAAVKDRTTSQYNYVTAVKGDDGYYHKGSPTGPYILADLMGPTAFNKRLQSNWSVASFAVDGAFNYNSVDEDDPRYDEDLDDTQAISLWAMAANNSELPGLTVVNDELIELLNKFIVSQIGESNFNNNVWLEFCKYFDHYGYDKNDKGICDMTRNPIRGLLNVTALPTKQAYEGELDLTDIPKEYKNDVFFDRLLTPRGLMYLFVPETSGVYRFRTQSVDGLDTMGWLYDFDGAVSHSSSEIDLSLVSTDEQLENPDKDYNLVLTYYLEKGEKYIFVSCFGDTSAYGHGYTFTVERLGDEAYVWQYAGRSYLTFNEGEEDELGEIVSYKNVEYAIGNDGKVYVAKKGADGKYLTDADGKYVPNYDDPLYVDFMTSARFFGQGSLAAAIVRGRKATIVSTLSEIYSQMWDKTKPSKDGWPANTALSTIKGSALEKSDWQDLISELYKKYDDAAYIDNAETISQLQQCTTIGAIAEFLQKNFLDLFNFENIRFKDIYGIDEKLYKNYTPIVEPFYLEALATFENSSYTTPDKGCVKLAAELIDALNMFCKRVGGYPEAEDWLSLCAHYQYMGPTVQ